MAKASVARKARRAAAKANGQSTAAKDHSAAVISFNPKHASVVAAIKYGTDHAVKGEASALVEQFRLNILACQAGAMSPKHTGEIVSAINASIVARRKAAGITVKFENNASWASRKSEAASVLKLHDFACVENLFKTLATIDIVTFEGLYAVSKWIRDAWSKETKTAPSRDELVAKLRAKKKRNPAGNGKRTTRDGVVGMPGDAVRGLAHVLKCAKAFNKAHGVHLAKGDARLMTACIDNINALFAPTRALVKAREAAAAAKVSK